MDLGCQVCLLAPLNTLLLKRLGLFLIASVISDGFDAGTHAHQLKLTEVARFHDDAGRLRSTQEACVRGGLIFFH